VRGDVDAALREADVVVDDEYETGFVEHAYIEPEAGFTRRVGDRIEVQAVRNRPTWIGRTSRRSLGLRPRRCESSPPRWAAASAQARSFSSTFSCFGGLALESTGAHGLLEVRIDSLDYQAASGTDAAACRAARDGKTVSPGFRGRLQHRRLFFLGPTVAARVPVHASGPYKVPHYGPSRGLCTRTWLPAGAFRVLASRRLRSHKSRSTTSWQIAWNRSSGIPHPECIGRRDADRHGTGSGSGRGNPRLL